MIYLGDSLQVLKTLPDSSVQTCITSPPYFGLRDYGVDGQIGLEETPEAFVQKLVEVFREVRRVLRDDGTLWLNLGDSYVADSYVRERGSEAFQDGSDTRKSGYLAADRAVSGKQRKNVGWAAASGLKRKDLIGIPWRVALALQADGWYLRQDIIWAKPNPMPESVTDRCTKAHEYIFLLSKSPTYYYDHEAVKEPSVEPHRAGKTDRVDYRPNGIIPGQITGVDKRVVRSLTRNRRSVWTVTTKPYKGAHFATFPPDLIEPCVLAGAPAGGVVLDPFFGSGTTGAVAIQHGRQYVGIELNPEYITLAEQRLATVNAVS